MSGRTKPPKPTDAPSVRLLDNNYDNDQRTPPPARNQRRHLRLAALGAVPQRPLLGHRARGLQRRRQRLGLPAARPGPQQGLPLGRGRHRRHLRPLPAPVLRPRLLERPRPHPQGAPLRPDPARGQPRRGRQGVLLPPRQHADALVHEVPLQVPAGRVPLRQAGRGEPAAATARASSTSCSTPASSTRTATSTSSSSTPRPTPEDLCIRIEAFNRGPDAAPLHVLPHLWFRNTWGWARRLGTTAAASRCIRPAPAAPASSAWSPTTPTCRTPATIPRRLPARPRAPVRPGRRRRRCSPTTRPTRRASTARARQPQAATSRTPSTATSSTARHCRQPGRDRHQGAPCTTASRRAAGRLGRAAAAPDRPAASRRPARRGRRRSSPSAGPRPTSSTRPIHPPQGHARTRSACSGRRWPACCGPSRATSSTSNTGSTATTRLRRRRRRARSIRNQHWRHLNSHARHDHAGQVGVSLVRRLGPGVPLRRASRWSIRSSPRSSSGCCCSSSSSTPTGRSPPTSGSSPTSIRRSTPGRSGASTTWTASAPARPTATSWRRCFHKLLINFAWWVNKVDREGNNVFEGGFLGLDNITVVDRSAALPRRRRAGAVRRHRLDGHVLPAT